MSFVDYEERKLNTVIANFSEQDKVRYSEEVDYIKSLLDLLRKQKQAVKDAKTPEQKKKAKEDEDKTKKDLDAGFNQLVNAYTLKKLGNVTHKTVPDSVIEGAKLTKASQIYNREGLEKTKAYLQEQGLDNWEIDPLSSKQILVLKNGNKIKLTARGTDLQGKNLNDFDYDLRSTLGTEAQHNILVDGRKQIKAVMEAYPDAEIMGHGYSLGSNAMIQLGREHGFPTESYNGYITKNIINNADRYTGIDHTLWRSTDDLPSIRGAFLDGVGDFKVNTVPVLENSMNPIKAHRLENFTTNNRSGKESNLQVKMREASEESARHGELQLLNKIMHETGKKQEQQEQREPETEPEPEEIGDTLTDSRLQPRPKRVRIPIKETGTHHLDNMGIDPDTVIQMKDLEASAEAVGKPHPPLPEPVVNKLLNQTGTLPDSLSFVNQIKNREIANNKRLARNKQRSESQMELKTLDEQLTGIETAQDMARMSRDLVSSATPNLQAKRQYDALQMEKAFKRREQLREELKTSKPPSDIEMKPLQPVSAKPFEPLAEPIRFADMTSLPTATTSLADELELTEGDLMGGRGFASRLKKTNITPSDSNLLLTKRSRVRLPDGPPAKSNSLSTQINNLETQITSTTPDVDVELQDVIDFAGRLSPPRSRPNAKQSFTEWAQSNGVSESNHKKSIWQLAGGELTDEEKVGFKKTLPYNDEDTLSEFVSGSESDRASSLTDAFKSANDAISSVDDLIATPVRGDNVSKLGNVARETFKGISPLNLGVGILADQSAGAFLDLVDSDHKQPEVLRTAERGFLAGGGAAALTGGSLIPEAGAGAAAYLVGKYGSEAVDYGLESLGVNKDVSEGIASTVGGTAAGVTAVGTGSLLSAVLGGAATGAEEGAVAGGGIFSAEALAIGGIVGGIVGLGSYAWSKIHG
jgi:hypothetical protein